MFTRSNCCLIGIPDHQGVIHTGGRVGASQGPAAFRKIFFRLNGRFPLDEVLKDADNISRLGAGISENHNKASDFIKKIHLNQKNCSVIIGGSHDHGSSHLLGISQALGSLSGEMKLGCYNIDAHLDVRKSKPLVTSGSPFYLALESGVISSKRFIEFGIQSHCNGADLWEYVAQQNVSVVPFVLLLQQHFILSQHGFFDVWIQRRAS